MKHISFFFFVFLLGGFHLQAAMNEGQVYSGAVCNYSYDCTPPQSDIQCYNVDDYWIEVPHDGLLTISGALTATTHASCSGSAPGSVSLTLYNKFGGYLTSRTSSGNFTIDVGCVAEDDSFHIIVTGSSGQYSVEFNMLSTTYANDVEPNNQLNEALWLPSGTFTQGHIGHGFYNRDLYDKYLIVVDNDGSLQAAIEADASMYLELFSRTGAYMTGRTIPSGGGMDTILWGCLAIGDSFYLQVNDYECGGYKIRWDVVQTTNYTQDAEPNDDFNAALSLASGELTQGHIGYGTYYRDLYDKYLIVLDHDGSLQATIDADASMYLELFSRTGAHMTGRTIPSGGGMDTILWGCLAIGDSFYLQVNDYECGGYEIQWDVVQSTSYTNDTEPNDDYNEALSLASGVLAEGHIGYGIYDRDLHDKYLIVADNDGSLQATVEADASMYLELFSRTGAYMTGRTIPSGGGMDTILWGCLAIGDSFYLQVNDYECGGYKIGWNIIDTVLYSPDTEPNSTFPEALPLAAGEFAEGHIGYGIYIRDLYDYYQIVANHDGTLQATIESGAQMYYELYNKYGGHYTQINTGVGGGMDTILIGCIAIGDTFYLQVDDYSCGGYKIRWDIVDTLDYDYDLEPNNSIAEATDVIHNANFEGHIGYGFYTNDNNDYYRTNMNGIGSMVVSGKTSKTTYLSFYKGTGLLGSHTLNGNYEVVRTCLNAANDIYLRFDDYSNNCNGYEFAYELFYDGNNSGTTADTIDLMSDSWLRDNIGYNYGSPHGRDNVDVLKIVPLKGDMAIFNAESWANIAIALYDDQGVLLYDNGITNDTTSFSHFLHVLETYYLKITYGNSCTPYKVKYAIPAVCPSELYVTGNLTQSTYKAGQKIISDGTIPSGSNVIFRAQEIDLLKNFNVEHSAVFNTQTGGCQ
jgi:hypothetical protein